jgi:hypothetical protein
MPRQQSDDLSPQERDLQQLLQLAQLHQLVSQPDIEQQRVDQTEHANRMTAAIHLLGLQQDAEQKQAAIEEQTRLREASVKGNITDALLSHVFNDPSTPLETKLDFAGRVSPEAAQMVKDRHAEMVTSAIKNNTGAYQSLVSKGAKPEVLAAFKTSQQIPDEAWEHIKKSLPDITATPPDTTSTGTKLGGTARSVGLFSALSNPAALPFTEGYYGYQTGKKLLNQPGFVQDFWNALINKPKTATQ